MEKQYSRRNEEKEYESLEKLTKTYFSADKPKKRVLFVGPDGFVSTERTTQSDYDKRYTGR